jgi:predicted RNA binding protein YcfA (HicA-like mRNA interferase family)
MKPLSGRELARLLEQDGWALLRVRQPSHLRKPGSEVRISIPIHGRQSLKSGLQRHLMKAAGLLKD